MRGTLSILHLETCKGVLPALSPEHSPTHPLLVFSHVAGAQGHTHSPEVPGPDHSSGDVYRAGPGPGVGKASYCWADIQAGAPRARRSSQARLRIHRDVVLKMDKGCVPGNSQLELTGQFQSLGSFRASLLCLHPRGANSPCGIWGEHRSVPRDAAPQQ